jgi:hypothetical protein
MQFREAGNDTVSLEMFLSWVFKPGRFANAEGVKQNDRVNGNGKLGKCQLCTQFSLHGEKGATLLWHLMLKNCSTKLLAIDLFITKVGLRMNSPHSFL